MNLSKTIITGGILDDIAEDLGIEILDWSYSLGLFSAGLTRLKSRPDKPLDHARAMLVRYVAKTYPKTHRICTTSSGVVAPRGKGTSDTGLPLIQEMMKVYKEHPTGIEFGGQKLDLDKTGHLSVLLVKNYFTSRNYLNGDTTVTNGTFRWVDIVTSRLELSPLRGVKPEDLGRKSRKDPELDLIREILYEEAEAHGIDPPSLLKKGWHQV